ncbi:MAG: transporter substrate-binding domain-containing protein [Oleiphilaceae bacterium]|nr:transporter substrate-binding domain-containing protein [Oleiphilaceae bacterium]
MLRRITGFARHLSAWGLSGLLLLSLPAAAGCDCDLDVGWEPWQPYQFLDSDGHLTGLDVELMRAVASAMGCQLNYRMLPWSRTLFEIRQGGLVTVAAGADKTPERQNYAYFSDPYRKESVRLFVRRDKQGAFVLRGLEDIAVTGFRLGVTRDYYYGDEFARLMRDDTFAAQVEAVRSDAQNHEKLMLGRIDGFLADPATAAAIARDSGYSLQFLAYPMAIKDDDIHVMFSKAAHSPDMVERFNRALEAVRESGEYSDIVVRYLKL